MSSVDDFSDEPGMDIYSFLAAETQRGIEDITSTNGEIIKDVCTNHPDLDKLLFPLYLTAPTEVLRSHEELDDGVVVPDNPFFQGVCTEQIRALSGNEMLEEAELEVISPSESRRIYPAEYKGEGADKPVKYWFDERHYRNTINGAWLKLYVSLTNPHERKPLDYDRAFAAAEETGRRAVEASRALQSRPSRFSPTRPRRHDLIRL